MSERKRGSGGGEGSWENVPEKKARGGRGNNSVDTSLSLLPPGGVEVVRSAMGPQHLQAAAVRAQALETQDLISAFDRPVASSVNDVGTRTLDLMSSIDPRGASSSNHQAGGRHGEGHGSAPPLLPQGGEARVGIMPRPNAVGPGIFPGNATGTMETPVPQGRQPPLSSLLTDPGQFLAMQFQQSFATPGGQTTTWTGEASRGITPRHDASPSEPHGLTRALAPPAAGKLVASTGASGSHLPHPQTLPGLCPGCHRRRGIFWRPPHEPASPGHICLCTDCLNDRMVTCPVCVAEVHASDGRRRRNRRPRRCP